VASPRIKKILDHRFSYGVAYTMHAAINRNKSYVDPLFFLYGLIKGSGDFLAQIFGQKKINKVCIELAQASDDEENTSTIEPVDSLNQLVFAQSVSKCVEMIRSGRNNIGLLGAIASICAENSDAMDIMEMSGISREDVEKAAAAEITSLNPSREKKGGGQVASSIPTAPASPISELCLDMTAQAASGELNRTFCREEEIDSVILSLMRKIKSNPLLIGDPGVGKTAIVEGLAYRINSGKVPEKLVGARLYSLAMSTLVSGTSLRGQFEERLRSVIENICSEENALLFIDEVHMLVGAGDNSGVMDAGNILKPYLARGELRCIGATTFRDYNRTIKKDGALSRRFQKIVVHEVDSASTLDILEGLQPDFEAFHGCKIDDGSLGRIVDLSNRYLSERRFPDKAIDCLDDSCARAVMNSSSVDNECVERSIASIANVPVEMLRTSDEDRLEDASNVIKGEVLGNDEAIDEMCRLIRSGLQSGKRSGSLLCSMIVHGAPGVGKTTSLERLSEIIFGNGTFMSINGAEYVEPHSISKIIGSPPGYIGYNEESQIVRQIRRSPHSMIVIKGVGGMNSSVREQIFDMLKSGRMTTGDGDEIDLGNAVFVFIEDSEESKSVGFTPDSSNSSTKGLDRWNSYGIFEDVDGVVKFKKVKSPEVLERIARMEISVDYDGLDDKDVDDMIKNILEENAYASPSKIRREVRRGLERLVGEERRGVDASVDVLE